MAKFESEGYCPHNAVSTTLLGEADDPRLLGLWSMLGPSVVCYRDEFDLPVDTGAVVEMFAKDPIAYQLMSTILSYTTVEKVCVFQNHKYGCSNQQHKQSMLELLLDSKTIKPVLVLEDQSRFAVVLTGSEDTSIVNLHMWDLRNCW